MSLNHAPPTPPPTYSPSTKPPPSSPPTNTPQIPPLGPLTLTITNQTIFIQRINTPSTPQYHLSRPLSEITETTQTIRLSRHPHPQTGTPNPSPIYDLVRPPPITQPDWPFHANAAVRARRRLPDILFAPSSRTWRAVLAVNARSAKVVAKNAHHVQPYFEARAGNRHLGIEWRVSFGGRDVVVAREGGENGGRVLEVEGGILAEEGLDSLVAVWCLRIWESGCISCVEAEGTWKKFKRIMGSKNSEITTDPLAILTKR